MEIDEAVEEILNSDEEPEAQTEAILPDESSEEEPGSSVIPISFLLYVL